jgi:hypothetical protein
MNLYTKAMTNPSLYFMSYFQDSLFKGVDKLLFAIISHSKKACIDWWGVVSC